MTYLEFVQRYADLLDEAASSTSTPVNPSQSIAIDSRPKVLIFAPHPDDESIVGALPLRLSEESGFQLVNVPVTFGNELSQRERRKRELNRACSCLGFAVHYLQDDGLSDVNPVKRVEDPAAWATKVQLVTNALESFKPVAIFLPHENDAHPTHIGVHHLVKDGLQASNLDYELTLFETEFWHPMTNANLIIESTVEQVAQLVKAIACHAGEVQRNPYHLTQTAWMVDNARRGSELVHGFGQPCEPFRFATLYRYSQWTVANKLSVSKNTSCSTTESLSHLFPEGMFATKP